MKDGIWRLPWNLPLYPTLSSEVTPNHPRSTNSRGGPIIWNGNYKRSKVSYTVPAVIFHLTQRTKWRHWTQTRVWHISTSQAANFSWDGLVMVDPMQQGHTVKTQHWNVALIPSQSSQITRLNRSHYIQLELGLV